jgi:methanogenic corrinoid protein MtbC1
MALHALFRRRLGSLGLPRFVMQVAAPLTSQVGQAWAAAEIGVDQEHLFTEVMTTLLASATLEWPVADPNPALRVLFTTVPGESHGLGLRMAQAICAAEGASTICLGLQTPMAQTVEAALRFRAHALALSFSAASSAALVAHSLTTLRERLPTDVTLWVGGRAAGLRRLPDHPRGSVFVTTDLDDIGLAVRQLKAALAARAGAGPG